jgi:hypothetical protein
MVSRDKITYLTLGETWKREKRNRKGGREGKGVRENSGRGKKAKIKVDRR